MDEKDLHDHVMVDDMTGDSGEAQQDAHDDVNSSNEQTDQPAPFAARSDAMTNDGIIARIGCMIDEKLGGFFQLMPQMHDAMKTEGAAVKAENHELRDENKQLRIQVDDLQKQNSKLGAERNRHAQENQILHGIIRENKDEVAPLSDEMVERAFDTLVHSIETIIHRYLGSFDLHLPPHSRDTIDATDRLLLKKIQIADVLYTYLFHPTVQLFGLDEQAEQHLTAVEVRMENAGVPEADLNEWRKSTIKATQSMRPVQGSFRSKHCAENLRVKFHSIREKLSPEKWEKAREEIQKLCDQALELALTLRQSSARYLWLQEEAFNPADPERAGKYDVVGDETESTAYRLIVGRVVKMAEGEEVWIRKGEVLACCVRQLQFRGVHKTHGMKRRDRVSQN